MNDFYVGVKNLENGLNYLQCTNCGSGSLSIKNGMTIYDGKKRFKKGTIGCASCGEEYTILDGVVYFFDSYGTTQAKDIPEIKKDIESSIEEENPNLCLDSFTKLAYALSTTLKDDRKAMAALFAYEKELLGKIPPSDDKKRSILLQSRIAAGYNIEDYRGTYVIPPKVIGYVKENIQIPEDGIIFEGALGTGENILSLTKEFGRPGDISIGLDISEKMVRESQELTDRYDNILILQGNLLKIPIRDCSAKIANANNVWDRVQNPPKGAREIGRILKSGGLSLMSNCDPLQFELRERVYVPTEYRNALEDVTRLTGSEIKRIFGKKELKKWGIETISCGYEELPMKIVVGVRR